MSLDVAWIKLRIATSYITFSFDDTGKDVFDYFNYAAI